MVVGTVRDRGVIQVSQKALGYGFPLCAPSAWFPATPAHIGRCLRSSHLPGIWSPGSTLRWQRAVDPHLERFRRAGWRLHFRRASLPRICSPRGSSPSYQLFATGPARTPSGASSISSTCSYSMISKTPELTGALSPSKTSKRSRERGHETKSQANTR